MSNHRFDQIENMLQQLIKMQATNNTCIEEIRQDIKEIKETQSRHERILEVLSIKSVEAAYMKLRRLYKFIS